MTKAICVIQEAGNVGLEQRCDGCEAGLRRRDGEPAGRRHRPDRRRSRRIKAKLQADKSIDGVLTLGASRASAPSARSAAGSKAKVATFDLNADVITAIKDGDDPLRRRPAAVRAGLPAGHARSTSSAQRQRHRRRPAGLLRPGFVTKDNADAGRASSPPTGHPMTARRRRPRRTRRHRRRGSWRPARAGSSSGRSRRAGRRASSSSSSSPSSPTTFAQRQRRRHLARRRPRRSASWPSPSRC